MRLKILLESRRCHGVHRSHSHGLDVCHRRFVSATHACLCAHHSRQQRFEACIGRLPVFRAGQRNQQPLESPRDFRNAYEDGIVIECRKVRRKLGDPAALRQTTSLDE
jgi:hypothetical protein